MILHERSVILETSRASVGSTRHGSNHSDVGASFVAAEQLSWLGQFTAKRCTKCGDQKPVEDYGLRPQGRGGREAHCRACARIRNRDKMRKRRLLDRDKVNEQKRKYAHRRRLHDPDGHRAMSDRAKATRRRSRLQDRERTHAHDRAKYRRAMERAPEARLAQVQRRIARKHAAPGRGVAPAEWRQVKADSLGLCAYCSRPARLTMDHIEPLAGGGAHDPDNIAAACKSCNSSKNDSQLIVWLARRCVA